MCCVSGLVRLTKKKVLLECMHITQVAANFSTQAKYSKHSIFDHIFFVFRPLLPFNKKKNGMNMHMLKLAYCI